MYFFALCIFCFSFFFFTCTYKILCMLLLGGYDVNIADAKQICMRLVSSIQAILACLTGGIIMASCSGDKIKDKHWLVEPYGLFMSAYLYYDTYVMFESYLREHAKYTASKTRAFLRFIQEDPAMMIHHLVLPLLLLPIVMYFRRGLGDYFIGFFLLIEAFIPFVSLREILILMDKQYTTLYLINGFMVVIVYTSCRILIFPLMYWSYGLQINQPFYLIPLHIPSICNIGCAGLLVLFLYWWHMILTIAYTEITERFFAATKCNNNNVHNNCTISGKPKVQ